MAKRDLMKDAIGALKISQPYRLQNPGGISLKAPSAGIKTPPAQINPGLDQPQVNLTTGVDNPRANQSHVDLTPDSSAPSQIDPSVKPPRLETTPVEATLVHSTPVKSTPVDSIAVPSSGFDVARFMPVGLTVEFCEKSEGSFMIPHKIYEFAHKAIGKKVELLVFHCLLRFTLGFRRARCETSLSFISKWTGVEVSNIRKALAALADSGLILFVRHGTADQQSAQFELPIVREFLAYEQTRVELTSAQINRSQNNLRSNSAEVKNTANPGENNLSTGVILTPKKEILENKESNKTHTPGGDAHEAVKRYFAGQLPPKRREKDFQTYLALAGSFSEVAVGKALDFVHRNGMIGSGAPVYSPWDYLSHAMPEVLKTVQQLQTSQVAQIQFAQQESEKKRLEQLSTAREEQEVAQRERAFVERFPTAEEQNSVIDEMCKGLPWKPGATRARLIGVGLWWDKTRE